MRRTGGPLAREVESVNERESAPGNGSVGV